MLNRIKVGAKYFVHNPVDIILAEGMPAPTCKVEVKLSSSAISNTTWQL